MKKRIPSVLLCLGLVGRFLAAESLHAPAEPETTKDVLRPAETASHWTMTISPINSYFFSVSKDGQVVLNADMRAFGPNWRWAGSPKSTLKAAQDSLQLTGSVNFHPEQQKGQEKDVVKVNLLARQSDPKTIVYRYELAADQDQDLTALAACFVPAGAFTGKAVITQADGAEQTLPFPTPYMEFIDHVSKLNLQIDNVGSVVMNLDPPCQIYPETNDLRIHLAHDKLLAGTHATTVTMNFSDNVTFEASQEQVEKHVKPVAAADWFAFQPKNITGEGPISMNNWLDKPAGKHGMVKMVGDHFEFADGTRVKFWGVNLPYKNVCPVKKDADLTAARFAKYGVNSVRLHHFSGSGWEGIGDPNDATKWTPDGLDRMDYFCSKLAENGVYYGFSHTFEYRLRPGNRSRFLAYDEIERGLKGNTYGLKNFAEDCQDLLIEMAVNLLKHKNPYTGKTYAEDPALAYVELQNEDDIFFYTTGMALDKCPTYRKNLMERFSDWLKTKYGSPSALAAAWGNSLEADETLEGRNIAVQGNPWCVGTDGLADIDEKMPVEKRAGARQRLFDNAAFLHEVQDKFYSRYVKAIRDTGYQGPLVGSPWQAPAMAPHYYNLLSDDEVGWIDRHNYFGKGRNCVFDTMMPKPGSGYLGSGLQRVVDRPFGLSEWINIYPDTYRAEGPAIMAVYGLGLQGWNSSYEFASHSDKGFQDRLGWFPWGLWEADTPTEIGQFPILARMIHRGDVKEGEIISTRRVSPQNLAEGKFDFADNIKQSGDIKEFAGTCPPRALAAGRCVVEFVEKNEASAFPDMSQYEKDKVIASTTKQLRWDYSDKGFFTVDTEGTKAVVGFAGGKEVTLGDVKIAMQTPYASLFVTAADKDALAKTRTALISAVARTCSSGFKYSDLDHSVVEQGAAPILLEPVRARITWTGRAIAAVNILDHDGLRRGQTAPVRDNSFEIDGAKDQALYYEVVFQ